MDGDTPAYGLWFLVAINSTVFILFARAWHVLFEAQRTDALATTGPYAHVRHPPYLGFMLIMFGFILQWPTLLTLAMFPVLTYMYLRLARLKEREVEAAFGAAYRHYVARTPAFLPRLGSVWATS